MFRLVRVSTTSLARLRMVPTFSDAIRNLNLFCRISQDIDLAKPTETALPLTTPSPMVPAPFSLIFTLDKTHQFRFKQCFTNRMPFLDVNLIYRIGDWVIFQRHSLTDWMDQKFTRQCRNLWNILKPSVRFVELCKCQYIATTNPPSFYLNQTIPNKRTVF